MLNDVSYVVSLLCPVTYCVSVSMYDYDSLKLYKWSSFKKNSV